MIIRFPAWKNRRRGLFFLLSPEIQPTHPKGDPHLYGHAREDDLAPGCHGHAREDDLAPGCHGYAREDDLAPGCVLAFPFGCMPFCGMDTAFSGIGSRRTSACTTISAGAHVMQPHLGSRING